MNDQPMRSALVAGILGDERAYSELLDSIVQVARAIFDAQASSITLLDEEADELIFRAVAGEGADTLVGRRFRADQGIAGWVLVTREPLAIEDVRKDERFASDIARATGFVPEGLLAVPLIREDRALGVLEVLDGHREHPFGMADMDLLTMFARQASVALDLAARATHARSLLEGSGSGGPSTELARLASRLEGLDEDRIEATLSLLASLEELLSTED